MTADVSMATVVRVASMAPRLVLVGAIRGYQLFISTMLGPRCKYYPSCSTYGLQAVQTHGAAKGSVLAAWRVLRCNPWSYGGVDDVPAVGAPLFARHDHEHNHPHDPHAVASSSPRSSTSEPTT